MNAPYRLLLMALAAVLCVPAAGAKPLWNRDLGPDAGSQWLAAEGRQVVTVNWDGDVVVVGAARGRTLWKASNPQKGETPLVALQAGVVSRVWADSSRLQGLSADKGRALWERELGAAPTSLQTCTEHRAIVLTHRANTPDGPTLVAHAVDPTTGQTLWMTPVAGDLIAAGSGHVVSHSRLDRSPSAGSLQLLDCATGAAREVRSAQGPVQQVFSVSGHYVVASVGESPTGAGKLCTVPVKIAGEERCIAAADFGGAGWGFSGGVVAGDSLYFSVSHPLAHNLDPTPDSWLVRADLYTGEERARSASNASNTQPVVAGPYVGVGFGSTGAKDFVRILDANTLEELAVQKVRKSPQILSADRHRLYASTYDGRVVALPWPAGRDVPAPPVPGPVAPRRSEATLLTDAGAGAGLTRLDTLDVHPKRARTSGQATDGAVLSLAFSPQGDRLIAGGNDNRVRVVNLSTKQEVWKSPTFKKDVKAIAVCGANDKLAAVDHGGQVRIYEPGKRAGAYRLASEFEIEGGATNAAFVAGCQSIGVSGIVPGVVAHSVASGERAFVAPRPSRRDPRGFRFSGSGVVVPSPDRRSLEAFSSVDGKWGAATGSPAPIPRPADAPGELISTRMLSGDRVLIEYCAATVCTVGIASWPTGEIQHTAVFDIAGSKWFRTVPSTLETSPNGRFLFFHRDGIEAVVVDFTTDKRYSVGSVQRAMAGIPAAVFSPDGRTLALAMHPKPHQISLFTLPE